MPVDKDKATLHFFELLAPDDLLICRVGARNQQGLMLQVLGFSPECGKWRAAHDLRLRCFCPQEETVAVDGLAGPGRHTYEKDDHVRVMVLEARRDSQRLLVSMKKENIISEAARERAPALGFLRATDVPKALLDTMQASGISHFWRRQEEVI